MNNVTNDIEVNDIFEEEVNLTRSESREQAFMLLFSKSFDDEPLEEIIASHLKKGWTLSRISKPSLAILRLAIYEMKYLDNVPQSVSINEAVELAKKYTIDESKFVNGILGTCSREFSGKSEK